MDLIRIEVCKWDKYQPRRDVKKNSWFRLNHDIFDEDKFWDLSAEELCFYIWLLSKASKENSSGFWLSINKTKALGKFKKEQFILETLEKLQQLQVIKMTRNGHVTDTAADVSLHYNTIQDNTYVSCKQLPDLCLLWNEKTKGQLPAVKECSKERLRNINARLKEKPELDYWKTVFEKITNSDFLLGRIESWKASFDWIIKPGNHLKVIEGNYEKTSVQKKVISFGGRQE